MGQRRYLDNKAREILVDAEGIVKKETKPIDDSEVITAKAFIESCCKKLRGKNSKLSSYGLKHSAESWGRKMNQILGKKVFSEYVSNGAFIKGANEMGFVIFPIGQSHNCNFRLSVKR